ncbi:tetratricopeptide repeat protein [bacterium]|nr:tetratricopeptide repeat protein [bacterium]
MLSKHLRLPVFILTCFVLVSRSFAGINAEYNQAYQDYQESKTKEEITRAAERFLELADRDDAGALKANALYWAAECWYDLKEWLKALNTFEKVLVIPGSNKEEAARFKVAVSNARLGNIESAKWELERFLRDFPSSTLVDRARQELGELKK